MPQAETPQQYEEALECFKQQLQLAEAAEQNANSTEVKSLDGRHP